MNETYERYSFFTRSQKPGEIIDSYIGALRVLAKSCNFADLEDSLIRDRIVTGIKDDKTRRKLLCMQDHTLTKCISTCRAEESTNEQAKAMALGTDSETTVHKVGQTRFGKGKPPFNKTKKQFVKNPVMIECLFCGKENMSRPQALK